LVSISTDSRRQKSLRKQPTIVQENNPAFSVPQKANRIVFFLTQELQKTSVNTNSDFSETDVAELTVKLAASN